MSVNDSLSAFRDVAAKWLLLSEAASDGNFDFTEALKKLLGIDEDKIPDLIEKLDVDALSDLVDACVRGDAETAKKIIGTDTEETESAQTDKEDIDGHELMAKRLFSPKDKARKEKAKKAEANTELGEETGSFSFGIGDEVSANGHEATIKIPSAAGDTVGVMINGGLKMVDRKNVHPVQEGVLGMTQMPGLKPQDGDLKRIRELAGLPAEDDVPSEMPGQPAMTPPLEEPHDDFGGAPPVGDMGAPEMGDEMGGDMGAPEMGAPALPAPEEIPALPAPGGMPSPGSALEDAAALDQAISEIENLIPNVKISEFKTLVARLKALVSMAESAGKAALTEGKAFTPMKKKATGDRMDRRVPPRDMTDSSADDADLKPYRKSGMAEGSFGLNLTPDAKFRKPEGHGIGSREMKGARPGSKAQPGQTAGAARKPAHFDRAFEDKIAGKADPKKGEPKADKKDADGTRKTLMDYVREAEDGMETIGLDRTTAQKAIQSRMGAAASPQQAGQALDAMMASGKIKNQGGSFTMAPMNDEDFNTTVGQSNSGNATGGMSNNQQQQKPQQDTGQKTTAPGANVQGAQNSAYQNR